MLLSLLPIASATAQSGEGEEIRSEEFPPSKRLALDFGLGLTITEPSGSFPSLLFVAAEDSTGVAPAEAATGANATRWSLALYVPVAGRFGAVIEGGSRVWAIRYVETAGSRAVRMKLQTSAVALLGRVAILEPAAGSDAMGAFHAGLDAGIEFGFGPYRNLVETSIPSDTSGTVLVPVEGSFQGGDPFCGQTGLLGGVWGGFLFGENVDVRVAAGYLRPFAPLFSDAAVRQNDARLSQMWIDLRFGWLF